jgi:hypothetical protein
MAVKFRLCLVLFDHAIVNLHLSNMSAENNLQRSTIKVV